MLYCEGEPVVKKSDFELLKKNSDEQEILISKLHGFAHNIARTEDGKKVVGVSRSGAVKAFNNQLHNARLILNEIENFYKERES